MKVDSNADGNLSWEEFLLYIVLHQQGAYRMKQSGMVNQFGPPTTVQHKTTEFRHDDFFLRIALMPDSHVIGRDKYITTSKRNISLWDAQTLKHLSSTQNEGRAWITDSCCLYKKSPEPHHSLDKFAVLTADRYLSVYDLKPDHKFEFEGKVLLESIPMCADSWSLKEQAFLIYGDEKGNVYMLDADKVARCMANDMLLCKVRLHTDWVTSVRHVADLGCIITSSLDGTVKVSDPERNLEVLHVIRGHKRGIHRFAWSRSNHYLATIGVERHIMVWALNHQRKPVHILQGHNATVKDVTVDEKDSQLISVAADFVIKVWDLRAGSLIQSIDENRYGQPFRISRIAYDNRHGCLVSGYRKLTTWAALARSAEHYAKSTITHQEPVCGALFNPSFSIVITAAADVVSLWDFDSGHPNFFFKTAQEQSRIHCVCFTSDYRRLITAAINGTVKVWNFSSGQVLRECLNPHPAEPTGLVYAHVGPFRYIIMVGFNRKILLWDDRPDVQARKMDVSLVFEGHTDDILCVAFCAPSYIASGDYCGTICVWSMNGALRFKVRHGIPSSIVSSRRSSFESIGTSASVEVKSSLGGATVDKMIFLPERGNMLVSSGTDGNLCFWDLATSVLLLCMSAEMTPEEPIVALCTNAKNTLLIAGDMGGAVKVWDLSHVGIDDEYIDPSDVVELFHWRAHELPISSIDFIEQRQCIVTASDDCSVKLFTLNGIQIGMFGQHQGWDILNRATWNCSEHVPVESESASSPIPSPTSSSAAGLSPTWGDIISKDSTVKTEVKFALDSSETADDNFGDGRDAEADADAEKKASSSSGTPSQRLKRLMLSESKRLSLSRRQSMRSGSAIGIGPKRAQLLHSESVRPITSDLSAPIDNNHLMQRAMSVPVLSSSQDLTELAAAPISSKFSAQYLQAMQNALTEPIDSVTHRLKVFQLSPVRPLSRPGTDDGNNKRGSIAWGLIASRNNLALGKS
mmetsp:Transcript_22/g.65  ORF Transcript_22/g.65 Transcript_22/m.65 type:complete len:973 (+) Transcript_22:938-3856(+)